MMSSTTFSIAPRSVTCFMPRASTSARGIAALGPDDLEQVLGDLAGDGALADQVDDGAKLLGRDRRARNIPAFLVETAEQFVDHPVGGELAVARLVGEPASTVS